MRPTPTHSTIKAKAGALLALLGIVVCAPDPARADCRHPGDRPAIEFAADPSAGSTAEPGRVPPSPPCFGLQCSNQSVPPLAAAPVAPPRAPSWAIAIEAAPLLRPGATGRVIADDLSRPIRRPSSLFRPPPISL